jgi:hypothetical protein
MKKTFLIIILCIFAFTGNSYADWIDIPYSASYQSGQITVDTYYWGPTVNFTFFLAVYDPGYYDANVNWYPNPYSCYISAQNANGTFFSGDFYCANAQPDYECYSNEGIPIYTSNTGSVDVSYICQNMGGWVLLQY